jgi:hypothetical protein
VSVEPDEGTYQPYFYPASQVLEVLDFVLFNTSGSSTPIFREMIKTWATVDRADEGVVRNLLAFPIFVFNRHLDIRWGLNVREEELNVVGYYAKDITRVVIPKYSLYLFVVLAFLVLLWCTVVCLYCISQGYPAPNQSAFPEIEFAARCLNGREVELNDGVSTLGQNQLEGQDEMKFLTAMGNANSKQTAKRVAEDSIFVGAVDGETDVDPAIVICRKPGLKRLEEGKRYT